MKPSIIKAVMQTQFETCVTAFISLDFMRGAILKLLLKSNKMRFDSNISKVIRKSSVYSLYCIKPKIIRDVVNKFDLNLCLMVTLMYMRT